MTATLIGHNGSHATSGPSLSLMLLLLLSPLIAGGDELGSKEESGLIMDELPVAHRDRLKLLYTVLALDEQWSFVWSEKLKPEVLKDAYLDKEFCPSLEEINDDPVDTLNVIKLIVKHCSHSGMYVEFAVNMIAQSVNCLFIRHSKLQLDTIQYSLVNESAEEFALHFIRLVTDFELIADRLASVGADLNHLITLSKFFMGVSKRYLTMGSFEKKDNDKYNKTIARKVEKLVEKLDESGCYCAVSATSWYNRDSKEEVSLEFSRTETLFIQKKKDEASSSTEKVEEVTNNLTLRKAQWFRSEFRDAFENLLSGILPPYVWRQIFEKNILIEEVVVEQKPGIIKKITKRIMKPFRR